MQKEDKSTGIWYNENSEKNFIFPEKVSHFCGIFPLF